MKRTVHGSDICPVARSLDVIGDWWSLLIVRNAMLGTRRFSDFQKQLGVAKNILSSRLRMLVEHEILAPVPASDGSAYKEYVLTPKGLGLFPVLVALRQWGEEFAYQPNEEFSKLVDRKSRRPLRKLEIRSEDGRLLNEADTAVMLPN